MIDEADRLLDMGFEPQLTRIARSFGRDSKKQSILCSATFPAGVQRLAADFLDPKYYFVSVGKVGSTHSSIKQRFEWVNVYGGNRNINRNNNNGNQSMRDPKVESVVRNVQKFWDSGPKKDQSSVLVFTNTKDGAELYGKALSNKLSNKKRVVTVIHGDKQQSERNRAIQDFKSGKVSLLVATDVAARGLDVDSIGLVVQADAPRDVDTYTHRVGRTGRAGRSGEAVTLLDPKSAKLTAGLVDLLEDANQSDSIPAWLQGMSYISRARDLEEDMKIQAGSAGTIQSDDETTEINDEFSQQDFRRTAAEGSYGMGKDNSYRNFEDEAYSSDLDAVRDIEGEAVLTTELTVSDHLEDEIDTEIEAAIDVVKSFERKQPSKQLLKALTEISGSNVIADTPDKAIIDALSKRGQMLRFEYLGLFPFNEVSQFLMMSPSKDSNNNMPTILMVAEKPSIAQSIADALSGNRGPRQRRGISRALPVYEFTTDKFHPINENESSKQQCLVRVTSVVGHIYSLGFDFDAQSEGKKSNPREYFRLPVTKKEESTTQKLRVVDHLRALAGDSEHLVLWLDCDPEGENIAHEVMAVTRKTILSNGGSDTANRIHRAKFSAITPKALKEAFSSLEEPDPDLSRAVDARQELDLRIGVAMTRLLTWRCVHVARRFSPSTRMISYGPCQTPALSFCVDRLHSIERFDATKYWKINVSAKLADGKSHPLTWKVKDQDAVEDTRSKSQGSEECATYNQQSAQNLLDRAQGSDIVVESVKLISETISPPVGLNTVALLEAGSKAMGLSPKSVMNVAEKLYSAGFISYPRTETTRYDPNGFDARQMLREHCNHPEWGKSASYLLRTKKSGRPPNRGKDAGDHPPITPLKSATREKVGGGAAWRVYEFIVRNFIGSLHNDLHFTRTTASLALPLSSEPEFEIDLVTVDNLGFADACRWVLRDIGAEGNKNSIELIEEGQRLQITKASIEEKKTRPPRFIQEHELIRLMDTNRIGTDASMAMHVSNIVDRGYVMLCDETGIPLRPPLPPGRRKHNLPRQIGRYMIPTPLGSSLLKLFEHDAVLKDLDSPSMLSHPSVRRRIEEEVKQIALGEVEKENCVSQNLAWFEDRYSELENSLTRERVGEFGKNLVSTRDYLRYLGKLDVFEPKVAVPKGQQQYRQQQHGKKNFSKKKQSSYKEKRKFGGKQMQKAKKGKKTANH